MNAKHERSLYIFVFVVLAFDCILQEAKCNKLFKFDEILLFCKKQGKEIDFEPPGEDPENQINDLIVEYKGTDTGKVPAPVAQIPPIREDLVFQLRCIRWYIQQKKPDVRALAAGLHAQYLAIYYRTYTQYVMKMAREYPGDYPGFNDEILSEFVLLSEYLDIFASGIPDDKIYPKIQNRKMFPPEISENVSIGYTNLRSLKERYGFLKTQDYDICLQSSKYLFMLILPGSYAPKVTPHELPNNPKTLAAIKNLKLFGTPKKRTSTKVNDIIKKLFPILHPNDESKTGKPAESTEVITLQILV